MQTIGNKIYYNTETGKILAIIGERAGDVRETTFEEDAFLYPALLSNPVDFLQLGYSERSDEFRTAGSLYINPVTKELIIYPHFKFNVDKEQINADGIDKATITVVTETDCNVNFSVDNGEINALTTNNKIATLEFTSDVQGTYSVIIATEIYGIAQLFIEVI